LLINLLKLLSKGSANDIDTFANQFVGCLLVPIGFGREHSNDLPSPCKLLLQFYLLFIRQRTYLRLDRFAELSRYLGINFVRLGQLANDGTLIAVSGFDDDRFELQFSPIKLI